MFSRLSQFGKNLSEELTRINEEVSSARTTQQGQEQVDTSADVKIMNTVTPEIDTITKPEEIEADISEEAEENEEKTEVAADKDVGNEPKEEPKKESKDPGTTVMAESKTENPPAKKETGEPGQQPDLADQSKGKGKAIRLDSLIPGTSIKYAEVPKAVVPLLLKFTKYEKLYPLLYKAYKTEKKKTAIVGGFEKVLKERTPCSSIAEVGIFRDYLDGLSTKSTILTEQLATSAKSVIRLTDEAGDLKRTIGLLKGRNKDLEKEIRNAKKCAKEVKNLKKTLLSAQKAKKRIEEKVKAEDGEDVKVKGEKKDKKGKEKGAKKEKDKIEKKDKVEKKDNASSLALTPNASNASEVKDTETVDDDGESEVTEEEVADMDMQLKQILDDLTKRCESLEDSKQEIDTKYKTLLESESGQKDVSVTEDEGQSKELQKENSDLKREVRSKDEEIENLRDMLRDVGDNLVESQKKIKGLESGDKSGGDVGFLKNQLKSQGEELEMLRVQNAEALKDYEQTKSSLTKKYKTLVDSSTKLQKTAEEAGSLKEENKKLKEQLSVATKLADSLKSELETLKKSSSEKGNEEAEMRSRIKILEEEKEKMNDATVDLKVQVKTLLSEEHNAVDAKNKLLTKLETAKKTQNEAMLRLNKTVAENNRLVKEIEELQDKYHDAKESKTNDDTALDSLKKRLEEVAMRNREYEGRIDILEEQLSQSRSMLQERTREASTIRKLVMDTEQSRDSKANELQAQVDKLIEEKERVANEAVLSARLKKKTIAEMKTQLETLQSDCQHLQKVNSELEKKLKEKPLASAAGTAKTAPATSNVDSEYAEQMMDKLRTSLRASEDRVRKLEEMNSVLQKANTDNGEKLVRMNKKYKVLSQQYRRRRSSTANSVDSGESRNNSVSVVGMEPSLNAPGDKDKAVYIRNVLQGYMEHKEQRPMLQPVLKTLLAIDDDEEAKFLGLLNGR